MDGESGEITPSCPLEAVSAAYELADCARECGLQVCRAVPLRGGPEVLVLFEANGGTDDSASGCDVASSIEE